MSDTDVATLTEAWGRHGVLFLRDQHLTPDEHIAFAERFAEIDLASNKVGVFGKVAALTATLNDGDRVEIYRPLIADPKEARKKRAAEGKAMKKGAREQSAEPGTS